MSKTNHVTVVWEGGVFLFDTETESAVPFCRKSHTLSNVTEDFVKGMQMFITLTRIHSAVTLSHNFAFGVPSSEHIVGGERGLLSVPGFLAQDYMLLDDD